MIRTVNFTSAKRIDCESCIPANVTFAVPPALVADSYDDLYGFIYGTIIETQIVPGGGRIFVIEYDDVQLENTDIGVLSTDIFGLFCMGIREQWIIDQSRRQEDPI